MAKSLFSALTAMALGLSAPTAAHAVSYTVGGYNFDFTKTNSGGQLTYLVKGTSAAADGSYGNSMTFRSTTDPLVQVKVSAWSIDLGNSGWNAYTANTADDIVTAATLKLWGGGFGVQNKYETDSVPNHSVDNSKDPVKYNSAGQLVADTGTNPSKYKFMSDFLLLQFDYNTDIVQMGTGWVQTDSDVSARVGYPGTYASWNANLPLNNAKVYGSTSAKELTDYIQMGTAVAPNFSTSDKDIDGPSSPSTLNIPGSDKGMMWLIGAAYGVGDNNDFFKLKSLNVTLFKTVPEPSTWMTMILGFGFVGFGMRRRNTLDRKGAAANA